MRCQQQNGDAGIMVTTRNIKLSNKINRNIAASAGSTYQASAIIKQAAVAYGSWHLSDGHIKQAVAKSGSAS